MYFISYNSTVDDECFILSDKFNTYRSEKFSLGYDSREWEKEPVSIIEDSILAISGWYVYKNRKNDIHKLHCDFIKYGYLETISNIECGSFVIYYKDEMNEIFFADPFGLKPHYYCKSNSGLSISPSPSLLNNEIDPGKLSILEKRGHLFGDLTIFKGVSLIEAGFAYDIKNNEKFKYYDHLKATCIDNGDIINYISDKLKFWDAKEKSIALSAGFDSRFLFASTETSFSYCWGPFKSKDRRVARALTGDLKQHQHIGFLFKKREASDCEKRISKLLLDGVVNNFREQFIANYAYVDSLSHHQQVAIDGYLGDVLQRGVYNNFSGKLGEVLKLFPFFYRFGFSAQFIMRKRYQSLNDSEFEVLKNDFLFRTSNLNLSEMQKVTYYEFVYGRGARFITTGSQVMNGTCKTVISPFAFPVVFKSMLLSVSPKTMEYKTLQEIWKNISTDISSITSEGMYSPRTKPVLIPFVNFFGRVLTNYVPRFKNYGQE